MEIYKNERLIFNSLKFEQLTILLKAISDREARQVDQVSIKMGRHVLLPGGIMYSNDLQHSHFRGVLLIIIG